MKNILLVLHHEQSGSDYHRLLVPYKLLERKYKNQLTVDTININSLNINNEQFWYKYQTVIVNNNFTNADMYLIDKIKAKGIKVIVDVDDYWHPEPSHPNFKQYEQHNEAEIRLYNITNADVVTVSAPKLFATVSHKNKNVYILPNCIEPELQQYQVQAKQKDIYRTGWIGGSSHIENIDLLRGLVDNTFNFALCGFNNTVTTNVPLPSGRMITDKFDAKERGIFSQMEKILTNDYENFNTEYKKYLRKYTRDEEQNWINQPYIRLWSETVDKYPIFYNFLNTVLYPLKDTIFNSYKSELRLIESFYFGCNVIASKPVGIHADFKEFVYFVDDRKYNEWRKMIDFANNSERLPKAKQLVMDKYRHEIYLPLRLELV